MANANIQSELYTTKTLFTLGGSSAAVCLFTGVMASVYGIDQYHYKLIGLIVAVVLSYIGALKLKKLEALSLTVAFFNGLLIYVTAVGINSINQGIKGNKEIVSYATLLAPSYDKAWWPTSLLQDSILYLKATLNKANAKNDELTFKLRNKKTDDSISLQKTESSQDIRLKEFKRFQITMK